MAEHKARTLGELYGRRRLETHLQNQSLAKGGRAPQPVARVRKSGEGNNWQYDYYPTRALILDEFDKMWASQLRFHGEALSEDARAALRNTIEWQHPLKSPPVGKCTLLPEHERAPKALPSSQRARILQEVNALRVGRAGEAKRALTLAERDAIVERLTRPTSKTAKVSFDQIRKLKALDLSPYDVFSLESEKRTGLDGDRTAAALMQKNRWGPAWLDLPLSEQDAIVDRPRNEEKEAAIFSLLTDEHGFDRETAERIADCPLPDGYGNLSAQALALILPALEADVTTYDKAVASVPGLHHSLLGTGEVFDEGLPYYGKVLERSVAFGSGETDEKRYGKVSNPTVHVALVQVRAVVNDLIRRFGAPEEIVLELARDLPMSARGKAEEKRRQADNQKANEARSAELAKYGVADTYQNRMKLRLYEELDALGKRCVFSGEHIPLTSLFTDAVEIEHILPFSRTLDDGFSNKTLATRKANRDKGNRSPHEAFGHSPDTYDWDEIKKRIAELPANKRWRFDPDAMERFDNEERDFLARQLNDTRYISRLAKAYLEAIYGGQGHKGSTNRVWVVTGRQTADLRHHWGLNSILRGHNAEASDRARKNREDHRHHAIDAIVIGCTDRAMLKAAADAAKQKESVDSDRLLADIEAPWDGFRDEVAAKVRATVISHKPDHGFQDAMHNDTAYGIAKGKDGEPDKRGVRTVVTRKPIDSFEAPKDLQKIRDFPIKMALLEATQGLSGKAFKECLLQTAESMKPSVRRVRIEEKLKVIPITDQHGHEYKAYKGDGNYCYDIWADAKGRWKGEVISTFDAYQLARNDRDWWRKPVGRDGQPLAMRIRKGDLVQAEIDGTPKILIVYKFTQGTINLAEHQEADASARVNKKELKAIAMAPSALQKNNAKRVTVSPSGVVKIYD
ncbi:MAG: type II CRISPR RNA-guided endonuclease Cas9 [Pseudomonadota bacterium]